MRTPVRLVILSCTIAATSALAERPAPGDPPRLSLAERFTANGGVPSRQGWARTSRLIFRSKIPMQSLDGSCASLVERPITLGTFARSTSRDARIRTGACVGHICQVQMARDDGGEGREFFAAITFEIDDLNAINPATIQCQFAG